MPSRQQVLGCQGNGEKTCVFRVSYPWPWSLAELDQAVVEGLEFPTIPDEICESLTGPKRYHPRKRIFTMNESMHFILKMVIFQPVMLVFRGVKKGDGHPAASPYFLYDWDRNPQSNIFGDPVVSIDWWHLYPSQMFNVDMLVETAWNMTRCLCLRRYRFIYQMELGSPWFLMLFDAFKVDVLTHSDANLQL